MSTRFCPECGESCTTDDQACPECNFPLMLKVDVGSGQILIAKDQAKTWSRMVQLLKRNGIRIEARKTGWETHRYWWSLPTFGFVLFLATLIFGESMVDSIWDPPKAAPAQVLDLAEIKREAAAAEVDSTQTDLLMAALRSTPDQVALTEKLNTDHSKAEDRAEASQDRLLRYARQALLVMQLEDYKCRGVVVHAEGKILAPARILDGAFVRTSKLVRSGGGLTKEQFLIQPMAALMGETPSPCRELDREPKVRLALLKVRDQFHIEYGLETEFDLEIGQDVYVATGQGNEVSLRKVRITGSIANQMNLFVSTISENFESYEMGSPVFDAYGKLTGILQETPEHQVIISLQRMNEKVPQFFKNVR